MKLLATDYDGTFKSNLKNLKININKVNKFMEDGNRFVIITGRSFKQIEPEIKKYNIKYNYLICNNGLIVFDKNNKIINCNLLPQDDLEFVYFSLLNWNSVKKIEVYNRLTSTQQLKEILEIHGVFYDEFSASNYKKNLEYVRKHLHCYQDKNNLFISLDLNKSDSIKFLQQKENLDKEQIFTVGDGLNDLEMLLEFNGYKMLKCDKRLLFKKIPTIPEIHKLIDKIK